jgi:deazaflavin-dependent oxidoreductase (nitroreductase family)
VSDGELASTAFGYLTTTGRVTGRSHRIEIWFALHDGVVYLLSGGREGSDWVRNIRVTPDVVFEFAGARRLTRARIVDANTDEDALARRLLLEKYDGPGEDLDEWARTSLPVAIDWPAKAGEDVEGLPSPGSP